MQNLPRMKGAATPNDKFTALTPPRVATIHSLPNAPIRAPAVARPVEQAKMTSEEFFEVRFREFQS